VVREARFPDERAVVEALFREYASALDVDLAFQEFDRELADLPGGYGPPSGSLLVATDASDVVLGCVALRTFGDGVSEMKRLFVRPAGRGHGVGHALVGGIIERARVLGYRVMRLDTLPSQVDAQRLYQSFGFVDIPPYRHNPIPGSRYLELALD
jgi:putative acetyltransferase